MPILPAEPASYPDDLWEGDGPRSLPGRSWWCLHARPRQEKATARHLRLQGIPHFLPQVVNEGMTPGGRRIKSQMPLFPGYLFLLGDDRDRVEALRGNHLVGILEVADQDGLSRDLFQIHRMLASGLPVVAEPVHAVGARIRITEGPLKGLVGVVARRQGRGHRFVAVVSFLNRGAAVELRDWQAESIDPDDAALGRLGTPDPSRSPTVRYPFPAARRNLPGAAAIG